MTAHLDIPTGRLTLIRQRSSPLHAGHLWVYAGHCELVQGQPAPGDIVDLHTADGKYFARGLWSPESKIRVRILTFKDEPIDQTFWEARIRLAVEWRRRVVHDTDAYRLAHGEADWLPGLVVDRYGNLLVMQAMSVGMDRRKDLLADLLMKETGVHLVYQRNDAKSRTLEGLPLERGFLRGAGATVVPIYESNARFLVDVERGQKTGWFCDQRANRFAVAEFAKDAEVLEVFCHTGAFGVHTALKGARSVEGYDVSAEALATARRHAQDNGVADRCYYQEADAFELLRQLDRAGRRYDLVILDPPAFARSKQAIAPALAGYKNINLRAMKLLTPGGILATCSCSHYVSEVQFWTMLVDAAHDVHRDMRLLEQRSQSPDHPILATMPETRYLKCFIAQVY